jgi:hypothetical protein
MTIGPEPKLILTGATLHTFCPTKGPLSTYKLFARTYGGKGDKDINVHNPCTVTKLNMVSLYDLMLDPFKGVGHCVVMDSAYMSDAMCQVGREEWKINILWLVLVKLIDVEPVRWERLLIPVRIKRLLLIVMSLFSINTRPSH